MLFIQISTKTYPLNAADGEFDACLAKLPKPIVFWLAKFPNPGLPVDACPNAAVIESSFYNVISSLLKIMKVPVAVLDPKTFVGLPNEGAAPNAGAPPKLGFPPNAGGGEPPKTGAPPKPEDCFWKTVDDPNPLWPTPAAPLLNGPGWLLPKDVDVVPKVLWPKADCCCCCCSCCPKLWDPNVVDPKVDWLFDPNDVFEPKTDAVVAGVANRFVPPKYEFQY